MSTIKHSQFTGAENLTNAKVVIVQSGSNKIAPIELFQQAATASNGITKTGDDFKLGGSLTGKTTISTGEYRFIINGVSGNLRSQIYHQSGLISLYTQSVSDEEEYSLIVTNGQTIRLTSHGTGADQSIIELAGKVITISLSGSGAKLNITGLPTSASGLATGDIWNDSGTLKIVL